MTSFTFTKEERLCHRKDISTLFRKGNSFYTPGFSVKWAVTNKNQEYPVKLLITVPKRYFKRAVDRNKVKRLIREAYRCNKNDFYQFLMDSDIQIHLGIVFTHRNIPSYKHTDEKISLILQQLKKEIWPIRELAIQNKKNDSVHE